MDAACLKHIERCLCDFTRGLASVQLKVVLSEVGLLRSHRLPSKNGLPAGTSILRAVSVLYVSPPGSKSMVGAPSIPAMACSRRTVPKPLRVGIATGGPPRSCQQKCSLAESMDHVTVTRPAVLVSAPCLEALVANSCTTKAKA